ncbi:c-type cytochrome [Pandoraea apista]|uniref:C-type cytochrome n=1 Tax=Pandoraea apista TaxID=93218 RepID=A0ABX9ZSY9_9BURK|nr:c-type cytochrome [Pandoraea apista]PTE01363.1 cytochrome c family protein [Pandoraea apista]RRJ31727.1 cytochrome c family protein [Pandoraea apista]RRJ73398.1 cytochrome c family protein [Pandoraea apista]RSD12552.1 c-type cytochrome [Pandoraea apista]RSD22633.1 c-type cytochrome [Pandoraea apista]
MTARSLPLFVSAHSLAPATRARIGALTLVLATLAAPAVAAPDIEAGKALFASRCASCHSVGPMAASGFGPQLNGLANRRAGSLADFEYSKEMKQSGLVWDDKTLAAFIANPGKTVPGTKMRFWGIGNERKVADLIAYLHTFK